MEQRTEFLKKLYYDPLTGLSSKDKFYKKAKALDESITMKQVKEFLDAQATTQITQQVKTNKEYTTIISPAVRNNYQADLMYLPNSTLNGNFKYILTCIDVYSRFVFVKPLKSKTGDDVFHAFKILMEEYGKPVNLNLDLGKEFIYLPFKKYCEDNKITLWYSDTEQENKNSIIERFHRTLRNYILRYEVANGKSYIKALPQIIKNYNSSHHNTINTEPIEIWNGRKQNTQPITRVENEFLVGDKVRHIVSKTAFDKNSSTSTFTKKIYDVVKIEKNSIYLEGIKKPFRTTELIKAVGEDLDNKYDDKIKTAKANETAKRRLNKEGILK